METQENSIFLFFNLPAELQLEVAGWLSIDGLGIFAQLSQLCNEYASSNTIWKRYFSQLTNGDIEYAIETLDSETKVEERRFAILFINLVIQIEHKYNEEEPGYYKALYFRYLAVLKSKWCASVKFSL